MRTQLPKYRKSASSSASSSFSATLSIKMSSLGKRKRSRGHENSLLHSVTARTALAGSKNHPKETAKPPCSSEFYPPVHSAAAMQPLARTRLRLHLLRVNNAKCAEHFCIFKHALERATPHCPAPDATAPPPSCTALRCNLKHKTRHRKSLSELATLGPAARGFKTNCDCFAAL